MDQVMKEKNLGVNSGVSVLQEFWLPAATGVNIAGII
jgi:hypothetical protein